MNPKFKCQESRVLIFQSSDLGGHRWSSWFWCWRHTGVSNAWETWRGLTSSVKLFWKTLAITWDNHGDSPSESIGNWVSPWMGSNPRIAFSCVIFLINICSICFFQIATLQNSIWNNQQKHLNIGKQTKTQNGIPNSFVPKMHNQIPFITSSYPPSHPLQKHRTVSTSWNFWKLLSYEGVLNDAKGKGNQNSASASHWSVAQGSFFRNQGKVLDGFFCVCLHGPNLCSLCPVLDGSAVICKWGNIK